MDNNDKICSFEFLPVCVTFPIEKNPTEEITSAIQPPWNAVTK
jgi:hypothetical protein